MLRGNLRRALALARRRTYRGEPLRVTLYERAGCGLCEEAHRALRRIALDRALDIARVDLEADATLHDRYAPRIPVLAAARNELDAAGLDDAAIARWMEDIRPSTR
ncbi:MAG TPA: glutaredoxin family protein [Candidatus Limnocylindria bacterium]|nr:glutaredoxin family protein [Candidatus Limnocylindria bacterium]